jgi:hypothetical protein
VGENPRAPKNKTYFHTRILCNPLSKLQSSKTPYYLDLQELLQLDGDDDDGGRGRVHEKNKNNKHQQTNNNKKKIMSKNLC